MRFTVSVTYAAFSFTATAFLANLIAPASALKPVMEYDASTGFFASRCVTARMYFALEEGRCSLLTDVTFSQNVSPPFLIENTASGSEPSSASLFCTSEKSK